MKMHTFSVAMTKAQAKFFHDQWIEHGHTGEKIICQCVVSHGPFLVSNPLIQAIVLTPKISEMLNNEIEKEQAHENL